MPTSNSVFVSVSQTPQLENVGYELRCLDQADFETLLLVSPDFLSTTFSMELNGVGGGSVTFSLDSELFTSREIVGADGVSYPGSYLYEREHLWQVYEDGELRFEWLGRDVAEHILNESETRSVTISGPGAASVLAWAVVLTKNFPNGKANDFWRFTNTPSMSVWLQLLQAAKLRGTIEFVDPTFTLTHDSAGAVWSDTGPVTLTPDNKRADYTPATGSNLLDLLIYLTGQDQSEPSPLILDWYMYPGFKLDVRPEIGTNRSNYVVFHESGSLLTKERIRTREEIGNYAVVFDIYGNRSLAYDPTSIKNFHQREVFVQKDRPTSAALRSKMAVTFLRQRNLEKSTWTIKVDADQPGRRVFVDYNLGDYVGIEVNQYQIVPYRVMAISVQIGEEGVPDLELTLQSLFELRQKELHRRVTKLDNAVGPGSANTIPYTAPEVEPTTNDVLAYDTETGTYTPTSVDDLLSDYDAGLQVFIQNDQPTDAESSQGDFWVVP